MLKFKSVFLYVTSLVCLMSTWTTLSHAQNQTKESQVITTANVFKKEQPDDNLIKFLNKNSIGLPTNFKELYKAAYSNMIAKAVLEKRESEVVVAEENTESAAKGDTENTGNTAGTEKQTGVVTASALNVRAGAGTGFNKIDVLDRNETVTIIGQDNGWYNIITSSGTKGWVYSSYVSVPSHQQTYQQNIATREGNSSSNQGEKDILKLRTQIIEEAKKYLGVPYVYGGSSPSGFDCSGLVWYVFKNHGISLNRVAADQAKQGTWVAKENLVPGDLVFFDTRGTSSYINHVGIYIGDGMFIHASSGSSARRVIISDLTTGFYQRTYMTARNVF